MTIWRAPCYYPSFWVSFCLMWSEYTTFVKTFSLCFTLCTTCQHWYEYNCYIGIYWFSPLWLLFVFSPTNVFTVPLLLLTISRVHIRVCFHVLNKHRRLFFLWESFIVILLASVFTALIRQFRFCIYPQYISHVYVRVHVIIYKQTK